MADTPSEEPNTKIKKDPKSAKQRMREYRERLKQNKEVYEAAKKKDREQKKEKYKPVADCSKRTQRVLRKQWRETKRQTRAKKNEQLESATSPNSNQQSCGLSRQKIQSLKKKEAEQNELKVKVHLLEQRLKIEKRKVDVYKKRCERMSKTTYQTDTPVKSTIKVLGSDKKKDATTQPSKNVKRQLVYHFALLKELKQLKKNKKKTIAQICHGEILKKYRLTSMFQRDIGFYGKKPELKSRRRHHPLSQIVKDFFLRIDVSRIAAGKKNVVRMGKVVKQRRILNDTLTNLYLKFKSENAHEKVSFITFWRFKPFWVGQAKSSDRDTCQCKYCENIKCFATAMYNLGALQTSRVNVLAHQGVCCSSRKECMFGECPKCREKTLPKVLEVNANEPCSWFVWKSISEERLLKNGTKKKVTLTQKLKDSGTFSDLEKLFYEELATFRKHFFTMKSQFDHYSNVKSNLKDNEVLLHVDFAENYVGKYSDQLQSVHFGASQPQISLHTGFFQTSSEFRSFCGVSDSLDHCPESIWAFLSPVLDKIRSDFPAVTAIHFFSDGPSQQYRQKKNFFLFCSEIFRKGFEIGFWNFFAPGHGKGIPDGIGAAVKRQADLRVKHGNTIMSSRNLIDELSNSKSNVMLYEVKPESFYDIKETLKPVKGTNSLQQLVCLEEGSVLYRNVSCTCSPSSSHKGHEFVSHCFSSPNYSTKEVKQNFSHSYFSQKQFEPDDDNFVEVRDISRNCPHDDFSDGVVFTKLSDCHSFPELQHEFDGLFLRDLYGSKRSVVGTRLPIDDLAKLYVPKDLKTSKMHFPVTVRADGNCLPACGSVYAFGEDINPELVRLHIIQELVTYQEYYLDEKNLVKGYSHPSKPNEMKKSFAMYSDFFIPNQTLSDEVIRDIYQKEVWALCKNKSFMGIWQLFALASVLKMQIKSVYPDKGSPMVRKHLNRKIIPRVQVSETEGMIMWTSTRHDNSKMSSIYWSPNHFVPLLQFSS